jgi:5-formyltetrahydrofolate cyclo-ligase
VALFSSRSDEVDTGPLIESALRDGKQVLLPRTAGGEALEFAELGDRARLRIGRFGIAEPPPGSPGIRPDADTVLLVPGLAFDRHGGRLGRGAGYYDRALAGLVAGPRRPLLIGAGFSFQLVERVPMMTLDVRLDGVVSELEIVETEAWGRASAREED